MSDTSIRNSTFLCPPQFFLCLSKNPVLTLVMIPSFLVPNSSQDVEKITTDRAWLGSRLLWFFRSIKITCSWNFFFIARNYSVVQKNSSMFEFAAFLLPTNLGQPMHSPSALTEHVSLNLAWFFLLYAVVFTRRMTDDWLVDDTEWNNCWVDAVTA